MSSSYFERLPEFADKLQRDYNVDRDVLRQFLFENALNEGDLDDELEQLYPEWDAEDLRDTASVADFPNSIPFEGFDIDPDFETLNAYRFAAENPKAREFVEQNSDLNSLLPGGTVDAARTAYLQAINSGALTPQQREALRYAGESRFLSDANYRSDAGEALNNILQAYTGDYDVDYSQNLENVADILEQADEIVRPVEVGLDARNVMMRYADSDTVARDPLTQRIDSNTVQPGLPLRGRDPGIAERYEAIRNTPPQTIDELNAQAAEIRTLRRAMADGTINTFPIEGSSLLPQVADFLAPGASPQRREYLLERAEREARNPRRNSLYQIQQDLNADSESSVRRDVEDALLMRRTVDMSPSEIDPIIPAVTRTGSIQFGIPGLENQLLEVRETARQEALNEQAKELNKFIEKYPEVGPYMQGVLNNPTPKIERNLEKLSLYLDLEQEISKPEARQDIYNLAMKELGVQPSYLAQIELDYTSGDTGKQKEAIDKLITMGYGEQLRAGSAPAVSRRMPVVGGGGYVTGRELRDALSFISNRADEFENITNTPVTSVMGPTAGPTGIKNPGLSPAPSTASFSFDPDTNTAYPDPGGEYSIRVNTSAAPARVRMSAPFGNVNEVSRNVLNYLRDNPITGMSGVSFETSTPTEGFSYEAKDIPAPVFEQMNKFISENVLRNMRPGMVLENSPVGSYDLVRLRRDQGKSADESSVLRREEEFKGDKPNRRAAAYRSVGFGPLSDKGSQLLYMNSEGNIVPLQIGRPAGSLVGNVAFVDPRSGDPRPLRAEVTQSREPLTSKAYYSMDPVSMAAQGALEYGRALRRTPAALLPGAADLIPSPEAIQTGYREGLLPMAQQMGREFVQGLPQAAAYSAGLAAVPALAPGVGAGMVGTAGARALNEVVRQETGEGIVPKLRQALGTAPRTGVASPAPTGPKPLTAQIRPLTQAQRTEHQRQQNRSEAQRQFELAGQRFNPRKGEFGVSETLRGLGALLLGR